ncbi:MAG: SusC/RagA family TonB-linked outer membrane protein [Prevotellaceae bacterium]|jgi:TonB-linked SusC/RagA family outer membrane protein|nr:SusC/RagA family TonB-linked outer membrane protein [Prevotellaceae bacterium]
MCGCSVSLSAQGKVSGKVSDGSGEPLAGVSVVIKGTNVGVSTDAGGNYSINSTGASNVLVFSLMGFISQEITVGSRTSINVNLVEGAATELEEIVVTALGVSKDAKKLGYAVSTIRASDLTKVGTSNFGTALYGKASGVRISSPPGGAASGVSFSIRGLSSINGNTQPLVIMDGVPIRNGNDEGDMGAFASFRSEGRIRSNGLVDINPEDIESISILKGAAATALYGSEAANGVVMITSKSSRVSSGVTVNVNATFQANTMAYMPTIQTEYGPGLYSVSQTTDMLTRGGFSTMNYKGSTYNIVTNTNVSFGPRYNESDILYIDGKTRKYKAYTDGNIWKELFRTGFDQIYNVAINSGGANSSTRFSYTYLNEIPNSLTGSYNKHNFNVTGNIKINKALSIDYSGNYIIQKFHNRSQRTTGAYDSFSNLFGSYVDIGMMKKMYKTSLGYKNRNAGDPTFTPDESFAVPFNPANWVKDYLWGQYMNNDYETDNRLIASVAPTWKITDFLTAKARISSDMTSDKIEYKNATENPLALENPSGSYEAISKQYSIIYGDAMLLFNKDLGKNISLSASFGWQARQENMMLMSTRTEGGLTVENMFIFGVSRNPLTSEQKRMELLKTAVLGTLGIAYGDFLFLEATARQEKSSTLPKGSNSYFYPSVNASFLYSDAFKSSLPSWYSYGKLRASYGIVGNAPEAYAANIVYNASSRGGIQWSEIPGTLGNSKLRPEKINEFEIGLENKFFSNRLGFEISYYNRVITDMLATQPLAASDGAGNMWVNIGEMTNKGLEISVTGTPLQTRDWNWSLRANLSFNKNRINKLIDGVDYLRGGGSFGNTGGGANVRSYVGRPMGDIYVNRITRVSNDSNSPYYDPTGKYVGQAVVIAPGYGEEQGWGYYRTSTGEAAQECVGNVNPKMIGGLGTSLTYKRITLDVMTDVRIGGSVLNNADLYPNCRGLTPKTLKYRDAEHDGMAYQYTKDGKNFTMNNGWIVPGVLQEADGSFRPNDIITSIDSYYYLTYNWGNSSPGTTYELSVYENSYWKLRELSVGYDVPENIIRKLAMKNLTVSVFGRNLFYLYKTLKDIDPESTNGGTTWGGQAGVGYSNAPTRTFGISLRATF